MKGSVSYNHSITENNDNDLLIFQCVDGWVSQYNQRGVSGHLLTTDCASYGYSYSFSPNLIKNGGAVYQGVGACEIYSAAQCQSLN